MRSLAWDQLEVLMKTFRQNGMAANFTEKFMMHFNEVRESGENGVPVRSAVSPNPSLVRLVSVGTSACLLMLLFVRFRRRK